jgi:hypothetical protein
MLYHAVYLMGEIRPLQPDRLVRFIVVELYSPHMSTEDTSDREDEPGGEDGTERGGPLFSMYRKYVGEPESTREVYVGFGTFFAGIALGVVGLVLFLYSGTQTTGSDVFWQFRETALIFVMLALPAVAMSVTVLLPVGQRTTAASVGGSVVCVAATIWLTQVYPYDWTDAGNDVLVLSTYAIGVVILAASTGSALVAQYLDRLAPDETRRVTEIRRETQADQSGESVSDDQVAEDIDEAMSDSTLTWGGVEQSATTKRLKLDMPETDPDVDRADVESATETRSASDDVDDAVDGLRQLQGSEQKTARAESPDDQVDALTEFREQQQDDEEIETGVDESEGTLDRLRERLFR